MASIEARHFNIPAVLSRTSGTVLTTFAKNPPYLRNLLLSLTVLYFRLLLSELKFRAACV